MLAERKNSHTALLIFIVFFPLMLMGLGLYYCSFKRGFSLVKISSKLPHNELWETQALSHDEKERLTKEILSQTYYYLGSGTHCYAFISQDKKYVVKFFKMHRILPKNWLRDFPFSLFEKMRLDYVEKRQDVFEAYFKSFKDAFDHLREECGLIYVHLNKSRDLKIKTMFLGFDGKKFNIDLDSKEFIVQLKTERICEYLLECKEKNKEEEARQAVRSLLEIVAHRCQRGYGDQNLGLRNNFGFIEGRAIFVDCSHFFFDTSLKFPQHLQTDVLRAVEKLSQWSDGAYPDLSIILQEEAQVVIDKYLK